MRRLLEYWTIFAWVAFTCSAQVTTGEILGLVLDPSSAAIPQAAVVVLNLETNATRKVSSDQEGRFRIPQLAVGAYEVTVEKVGFAKYVQGPIILQLNQDADLRIRLELAGTVEKVTVTSDAPLINTTNAEVGVNFDRKRISELPLAPNRNIVNLALSVAGVSQLQAGQSANIGISPLAVNGMRVRSNNFMIDGQDANWVQTSGLGQPINNPDIVAEFRLLSNQFAPEYGRAAGSVVNIVTKSGTNRFHGSTFWFHNDNHLNSRSNLDKLAGHASAPFRTENQFGGTLGGPIVRDKTFFFGSLQRWTDRRLRSGVSFDGAPTEEGRSLLNSLAGDRPTIRALLEHLPPAQAPVAGLSAPLTIAGRSIAVPLGTLTGSSNIRFDDWQASARVDHRFNDRHTLGGRYLLDDRFNTGDGQVTPPGLTQVQLRRAQLASVFVNSTLARAVFHELRLSYHRVASQITATDPAGQRIPSIEVRELGLTGTVGPTRTAIGLATDLPRLPFSDNYQFQQTVGVLRGSHSMKFGVDFRRQDFAILFRSGLRGILVYNTLQDLVDDVAQTARIISPLPGGEPWQYYKYYDYFFFLQDEWRIRPSFTLTYGIRYESPGNQFESLREVNQRVVAAAGGDQRFALAPIPSRDTNNWAPRLGFNYRLPQGRGPLRLLTGDGKLVLRGGYSRTYDNVYISHNLNGANQFPFLKTDNLPARTPNSWETLRRAALLPVTGDPNLLTRIVVVRNYRSPFAEQFALQLQRELRKDWALSVAYIGTKGTALLDGVDGNPTVPGSGGRQRVDPTQGVITLRCNCTSSIYHSLQTSLEKRLARNFSMAAHYTWSSFIDGASDILNPSPTGEIGIAQDSFNRRADRARSAFDRPHRLAVNGVLELPFYRGQKGAGKVLGGWQLSGFLTLQSGAPFAALDGADPGFRLSGLASTVRANVNTSLDLARMTVEEIVRAGGRSLFSRVSAANPLGNLGRNILRSSGISSLDLGLSKNTKLLESHILQFRAEFYNTPNTRIFGIPDGTVSSASFLNQWGTDGGNRRILLGLRYVF